MVPPKQRRPAAPDSTRRDLQASNRRLLSLERRVSQLTEHVLATLKRIEDKVDAAAIALVTDAAQIGDMLAELARLEQRVNGLNR